MEPLSPSIMVRQVHDLPNMTRAQVRPFDDAIRGALTDDELRRVRRVYITGDGDSYHAARSAELAFKTIARIQCEPYSAQPFLDYKAEWMPVRREGDTLVIAISASGRTQRGVQAIERAKQYGAVTVAITGTPGSPFTQAAERSIVAQVPDFGPSPGIRTYNASLMALLLIAIRLGEVRGKVSPQEGDSLRREIEGLAEVMTATIQATEGPAREAAEAFKDASIFVWVGSGPSYGTALFSAAKTVEGPNRFAVGQDLEEWHHVENLAYPKDVPTFVLAPQGRSRWRAVEMARMAKSLGRRVVAIVQEGDSEISDNAQFTFPIVGEVREEFSPLVYHIGADLFAPFLAESLGRQLFQRDHPAFYQSA